MALFVNCLKDFNDNVFDRMTNKKKRKKKVEGKKKDKEKNWVLFLSLSYFKN